jgi:hypothetical protein
MTTPHLAAEQTDWNCIERLHHVPFDTATR